MYKPSAKVCNFEAGGFFMENIIKSFGEYLFLEKKYSKHTYNAYLKDLYEFNLFVNDNFDNVLLLKVNYSIIRSWIIFLSNSGIDNMSINRKISSLKSFYKFLIRTKQIDVNPLLKHKSLKISKKIQIPYSKNELNKLLNEIYFSSDFDGIRDRLIIELLYSAGLRRSELINIKIKDLDLKSKTLKVLGKRNKERILPIMNSVAVLIESYLNLIDERSNDRESYLFQLKNGYKLNETFVYRLINHYLSAVTNKVKKSPHMLRHTFATHMLNEGSDINSVKELLGHSSLASTQVYTHNNLEELKRVHLKSHPRNSKK